MFNCILAIVILKFNQSAASVLFDADEIFKYQQQPPLPTACI